MNTENPVLPTFFVIGAPKCGTTSLHFYLGQHPEVEMTRVKEPQVFASPDYDSRLVRYESLFSTGAATRGESSVVYSQFPRWPHVPERIRAHVPDARFIYVVRDPIERAIAHYRQHVIDGKEGRPLADALADLEQPSSLYLCPSRYATQVQQYLAQFDPARLLVVDHGDLLVDREATLTRLFRFLEVSPEFRSPGFRQRFNIGEDQRSPTALGRRLKGRRAFEAARRLPLPPSARRRIRRLVSREVESPSLDDALRARLVAVLRDEVAWLREFSGLEFADWSL